MSLVFIKGAGDLASGVALRLFKCGMPIVMTELEEPRCVRRTVSFAEAVYEGSWIVEGVKAVKVRDVREIQRMLDKHIISVIVDPEGKTLRKLNPPVLVDAIMAKRNVGTTINTAPIVVALGPGFRAGRDVHAVIETNRGHNLGRVIYESEAEPNTGEPAPVGGYSHERVLRAPCQGVFKATRSIGDTVASGDIVADVGGRALKAAIAGVIRGLIHDGLQVHVGEKVGDIDARARREHCFTVSDKALAIAGGVLEAILTLQHQQRVAL